MTIETIMSSKVVTVDMDDSLKVVKRIFDSAHFHHLLVISRRKLVGVITDRDLLEAISPNIGTVRETARDVASLDVKVHQVMKRNPIVLTPEATVNDAVRLFNRNRISCIPIIDENYRAVGIVSWRDLLKQFEEPEEDLDAVEGEACGIKDMSAPTQQLQAASMAAEREVAFREAAEREAAKIVAKEAAKEAILDAARAAAKEAAMNAARETAKKAALEAAKEAAKRAVVEEAKAAAREAALAASRNPSGKSSRY